MPTQSIQPIHRSPELSDSDASELITIRSDLSATSSTAVAVPEPEISIVELTYIKALLGIWGHMSLPFIARALNALKFIIAFEIFKAINKIDVNHPIGVTTTGVLAPLTGVLMFHAGKFAALDKQERDLREPMPDTSVNSRHDDHDHAVSRKADTREQDPRKKICEQINELFLTGLMYNAVQSVIIISVLGTSSFYMPYLINKETAKESSNFLQIYAVPVGLLFPVYMNLNSMLNGLKYHKTLLASTVLDISIAHGAAALFAIYFDMGLPGLALGYSLSLLLQVTGLLSFLYFNEDFDKYKFFEKISYQKFKKILSNLWPFIKDGGFVALQRLLDRVSLMCLVYYFAYRGEQQIISANAALQLMQFFTALQEGIIMPVSTAIGASIGKRKPITEQEGVDNSEKLSVIDRNIRKELNTGIIFGVATTALVPIALCYSMPNIMIRFLGGDIESSPNPTTTLTSSPWIETTPSAYPINPAQSNYSELERTSTILLYITAAGLIPNVVLKASSAALRPFDCTKLPTLINAIGVNVLPAMFIGLVYLLNYFKIVVTSEWEEEGIFGVYNIGLLMASMAIYGIFMHKTKMEPEPLLDVTSESDEDDSSSYHLFQEAGPAGVAQVQPQQQPNCVNRVCGFMRSRYNIVSSAASNIIESITCGLGA